MAKSKSIGQVYLMRGLPCCGKTTTSRQLAKDQGIILETDEYFLTQVGDNVCSYDYSDDLLPQAQAWNYRRYEVAIDRKQSIIVVDRGNGLNYETYKYAKYALTHHYDIKFIEPNSPWWQEIRVLLKYKEYNMPVLKQWAVDLSNLSRQRPPYHCIRSDVIIHLMEKWVYDTSIEKLLKKFE